MMLYTIFIDMDDVICDFKSSYNFNRKEMPSVMFPQSIKGFFENLKAVPGAVEAVGKLRKLPDIEPYVLTAPSTRNPLSYTEKRIWIEKHFDYEFTKKLIICSDKSLLRGHTLIDDNVDGKGQENFKGDLIHFGSQEFPSWEAVINHILKRVINS